MAARHNRHQLHPANMARGCTCNHKGSPRLSHRAVEKRRLSSPIELLEQLPAAVKLDTTTVVIIRRLSGDVRRSILHHTADHVTIPQLRA
jgi:hypothetical protein